MLLLDSESLLLLNITYSVPKDSPLEASLFCVYVRCGNLCLVLKCHSLLTAMELSEGLKALHTILRQAIFLSLVNDIWSKSEKAENVSEASSLLKM